MSSEIVPKLGFIEYLPETVDVSDSHQLAKIDKVLAKFNKGSLYTVVLTCRGLKKCPYQADCPVQEHVDKIIGNKCPLERQQQEKWFDEYCNAFNVGTDRVKMQDIQQLVQLDLQIMRANQIISNEGFEQVQIIKDEEGEMFEKRLHNVALLLDKLETRRIKLLQTLDRPVKQTTQSDPSSYIAILKKKYTTDNYEG